MDDLLIKQSKHKELWKLLCLTWDGCHDGEVSQRQPGGAGGDGDDGQRAGRRYLARSESPEMKGETKNF